MKTNFLLCAGFLFPLCLLARADTVYLSNGDEINGTILENSKTVVVIKTLGGAIRTFRKSDVDTLVYEHRTRQKPVEITAAKTADVGIAPLDLPGFPDRAKRMDKTMEKVFMYALEKLASPDESDRDDARNDIADLGTAAVPYIVAGLQSENVEVRAACMRLLGQINARDAIKPALEAFYSAMPEHGPAPEFQLPFIRAAIDTLPAITGQSFIEGDAKSAQVQDGLREYIEWYNANFDKIPVQLGEPIIEATDRDAVAILKDARALNLTKKKWKDTNLDVALDILKNHQSEIPKEPTPEEKVYNSIFERTRAGQDSVPDRQDWSIFEPKPANTSYKQNTP